MVIFARVVETGSFSAAARRMGVSRAVVSYQINQLEKRLGVRLLNRSTRRVSITSAGRQYRSYCQRVASDAEAAHAAMRSLRNEPAGRITLACPVNLGIRWVIPVVNAYKSRYPKVELDVRFSDSTANVIGEGVDLAIRAGPLADSDLVAVQLATIRRRLCAAPSYLQLHGAPRSVDHLKDHQWVIYSVAAQEVSLRLRQRQIEVPMRGSIRTDNANARRALVIAGHGLAVLPAYDADVPLRDGRLVELFPEYTASPLTLFAVYPSGATRSRAVRLLLDSFREHPLDGSLPAESDTYAA